MVRIGNFLFHFRNGLFPVAYCLLLVPSARIFPSESTALAVDSLGKIRAEGTRRRQ
jgi:hypothetical protein